ncbi:MAG: hypothetical protein R6V07_00125 [Armatimonadota bacterium]
MDCVERNAFGVLGLSPDATAEEVAEVARIRVAEAASEHEARRYREARAAVTANRRERYRHEVFRAAIAGSDRADGARQRLRAFRSPPVDREQLAEVAADLRPAAVPWHALLELAVAELVEARLARSAPGKDPVQPVAIIPCNASDGVREDDPHDGQ